MTGFFVLGGSSTFIVLEDVLVVDDAGINEAQLEGCIFDGDFVLDVEVEGAGFSPWFLSFSPRCFKYNVLFSPDSDLWCPVAVDSTCSVTVQERIERRAGNRYQRDLPALSLLVECVIGLFSSFKVDNKNLLRAAFEGL